MPELLGRAVFGFASDANDISGLEDLNKAFRSVIEPFGFQHWDVLWLRTESAASRWPAVRSFGEPLAAWGDRYREQHYVADDPAAHEILASDAPVLIQDARQRGARSQRAKQISDEAKALGVANGIATSVRVSEGHVWGVALFGEHTTQKTALLPALHFAAHAFTRRAISLSSQQGNAAGASTYRLTPRMRQILSRLQAGETQTSIARALNVSRRTVEHLMHDARERLNVRTTGALIVEAMRCGEIYERSSAMPLPRP